MKMLVSVSAMAVMGLLAYVAIATSDEEIKMTMVRSLDYYHGEDIESEFKHAFRLCECDSNRFSRLIREVAETNDSRIARGMIGRLSKYGSTSDVDFLSRCIDLGKAPVVAAYSILQLQGVCSNSIAAWEKCLANTNESSTERSRLSFMFIDASTNSSVSSELRLKIMRSAVTYGADYCNYNSWYDRYLVKRYPDYVYSYERLHALSNGLIRTSSADNLNYITNALRELSEIPASEFHEFP